uniref:YlxR domain-containing protein n=1 Tax=Micromonas pusilla TaxID=38833 RepID=A0A7S0PTL9_MICPS|mmetsp:Transcript_4753/g.17758  ORF Transcript_4753/g.17758 Transcript_4753/m.17758 type:complete len:373 (+) Transcript_4753:266-1384(+)
MLRQGSPLKVNLWSHNILQSRDGPFSVLRVRRCLGSVDTGSPTSTPGGNDIGGYVDTFIKRVDEHWTFIAKPEHMRGILQNDRHCQPTHRNLPKDVLLRFALAEDENGEAWVIPDSNAVYPGRGMRVLPSYAALEMCAQSRSFTNSFKRPHVRLPLGIEDYVEAQLKRHTQLALAQALSVASSVKRIGRINRTTQNAKQRTQQLTSFVAFLSEAVSDSIAEHEKGLRTIDTSELCTNVWLLNQSDRMIEDSPGNAEKFYVGECTFARSFHALSDDEILASIELPEAERFRQSRSNYETLKDAFMRSKLKNEKSSDDGNDDNNVIAVEGVSNDVSSRLSQAQLRLKYFRESLANAPSRGSLTIKERRRSKRNT